MEFTQVYTRPKNFFIGQVIAGIYILKDLKDVDIACCPQDKLCKFCQKMASILENKVL